MKKIFRKTALLSAFVMIATVIFGCSNPLGALLGGNKSQYEIVVNEVFTCASSNGEALVINFDVTNNSDEYVDSSLLVYNTKVVVDGLNLSSDYLSYNNPYALGDVSIAPGTTSTIQAVFDASNASLNGEGQVVIIGTNKRGKSINLFDETINFASVQRKATISPYKMAIVDKTLTDDGEGNDVLVLTIEYTNNSEDSASFSSALDFGVYQNDKKLDTAYLPYKHPLAKSFSDDSDDRFTETKNGNTITFTEYYTISDGTADINVKAIDAWSFDKVSVYEDSFRLADVTRAEFPSNFQFRYITCVIGEEKWGDDIVVMLAGEFTNNSDEAVSFSSVTDIVAKQDGFDLHNAYLPGSSDFTGREILPGETTPVYIGWKLMTTGDVTITITDYTHYADVEIYSATFTIENLIKNTQDFANDQNMLGDEIESEDEMNL